MRMAAVASELLTLSLEPPTPPAPRPAHLGDLGEGATRRAFDALARTHASALLGFATKLAGNEPDARDLLQDTMERALRRFHTFTPDTNARAWLFAILHNAFIDRCRRRAAEPRRMDIDDVEVAASEPIAPPSWTSITPEQVTAAVAQLETEFRVVYEMHSREGLAYQDIATRLGIPVNTVGTRLGRARKKLRAALEALVEPGAGGAAQSAPPEGASR